MSMTDFQQSAAGRLIDDLLTMGAVIARMEELSRQGRPAVAAIDEQLAGRTTLNHTERQYVGRRVRDVMFGRGWKTMVQRRLANGQVLTSGMVYRHVGPTPHDRFANVPTDLLPVEERVARAQMLVRGSGVTDLSIDTYLQEKWAEADAEEARWRQRYGEADA